MKRILITGCGGFIGSHVTDFFLKKNYRVTGIDNFDLNYSKEIKIRNLEFAFSSKNFELLELDLRKKNLFDQIPRDIDTVIHLAGKAGIRASLDHPSSFYESNIIVTQNLLDWMKTAGVKKMIFASSSSVYGKSEMPVFSEDHPTDSPLSPYGVSKKACELINFMFHELYNLDIINLRFFTVYGERQRPDMAIYKFVDQLIKNKPVELFADGLSTRDYTYVGDIVQGISKAFDYLETNSGIFETINLGKDQPINLKTLINYIGETLGVEAKVILQPAQACEMPDTVADIRKAQKLLGYSPATDIREGLKRFVSWYKIKL